MANPGGSRLPWFVCVLPCTKPPVKHLDLFDGCEKAIHVTPEETKDLLASLYGKMAAAITALEDQSPPQGVTATPDPCSYCKKPIVPRHNSPVFFMENCAHNFHYDCIPTRSATRKCPQCQAVSSRVLLWPQVPPTAAAKNEIFQLQKRNLGLDVAPQTVFQVDRCREVIKFPAFNLTVNSKPLIVSKRPRANSGYGFRSSSPPKSYLARDDTQEMKTRRTFLSLYQCPLQCTQPRVCAFSHGNSNTLRVFPSFFCLDYSVNGPSRSSCCVRLPANYQARKLARCSAGFHPTLGHLWSVHEFAGDMAEQIIFHMANVPDPSTLVCAFCKQPQAGSPNPVVHLQQCVHWVHEQCLLKARSDPNLTNPERRLELMCKTCKIPSVRTLVWPGPFRTVLLKLTIFDRQLSEFWLNVDAITQLAIVEVANKPNTFTLDYGGASVATIDAATAKPNSTIYYD